MKELEKVIVNPPVDDVSSESLFAELVSGLDGLVQHVATRLIWLSARVVELDKRQFDMSILPQRLHQHLSYLRQIGAGLLLPECVMRFSGRRELLHLISRLPIADQKKVSESETLPMLVDGEIVQVDITRIPMSAVRQVIADDEIRDPDAQRQFLAIRQKRKPKSDDGVRKMRCHADQERHGIKIGNSFASKAEILLALAELVGPLEVINERDYETASVKLTKDEKDRLRACEKAMVMTEWQLVRIALRVQGYI